MSKINPIFILMNALKRGYAIFPDYPNQIYQIFTPDDLEEGAPGLYWHLAEQPDLWHPADHISLDKIIKIAYSLPEEKLVLIAAENALKKKAEEYNRR